MERKQKDGESFNSFYCDLKDIADNCQFEFACNDCNLCESHSDERFVTAIVAGINDPELKKKLLEKKVATLKDTIEICTTFEATMLDSKSLVRSGTSVSEVKKNAGKPKNQKPKLNQDQAAKKESGQKCHYCGKFCKNMTNGCPARDKTCFNCQKVGHFSSVCKKKMVLLTKR